MAMITGSQKRRFRLDATDLGLLEVICGYSLIDLLSVGDIDRPS